MVRGNTDDGLRGMESSGRGAHRQMESILQPARLRYHGRTVTTLSWYQSVSAKQALHKIPMLCSPPTGIMRESKDASQSDILPGLLSALHTFSTIVLHSLSNSKKSDAGPSLLLLPEHLVLQFICQSFVCRRRTGIMVYVSLSTATDVVVLVFRTGFMHCSLRDYIAVMCASRLRGFDLWGINIASTTALCIEVSNSSPNY